MKKFFLSLLSSSIRFCADPAQPGGLVGPFTARDIAKKFDDGVLDGLSLLFQQVYFPSYILLAILLLVAVYLLL